MRIRHLLLAVATLACCTHSADSTSYTLAGQIIDEGGSALAGAQVAVGAHVVTADASGHFTVPVTAPSGAASALSVTATGYASRVLRLTTVPGGGPPLVVPLRPVGIVTTVALPAAGEAPAVVTLARSDSHSQLSIPAGSLVDADGRPATGQATVTMTYWHAAELMTSAPGPVVGLATADGTVQPLHSAGMVDITVAQGSAPLQVAAGQSLPWQVGLGAASQAFYGQNPSAADGLRLWALDAEQATFTDPVAVTYDATANTLVASLPHLSVWNYDFLCAPATYDSCPSSDNGGCVRGRAFTCDGTPLANSAVRVWGIGRGNKFGIGLFGVKDFNVATAADGSYCTVLGLDDGDTTETAVLHVSGPDGPLQSNLISPLTGSCTQCTMEPHFCNTCANGTPSGNLDPNARSYTVQAGTFCNNAGARSCAQLPDVYIGSACAQKGSCALPLLQIGAACDNGAPPNGCCSPGLVCSDSVCVPKA